jgi:hypothetical protein
MVTCKSPPAFSLLTISLLLVLAGCTVSEPTPTAPSESVLAAPTIVISRTSPTPTSSTITPTSPATPSATPTSSSTIPPTTTPTASPTVTETPIPTPPGADPKQQVLWLYQTNNGCRLPCWWGIVPGQTTWETAEQFLDTFTPRIEPVHSNPNARLINYTPIIPSSLEYPFGDPVYSVRDGIVEVIRTPVSRGNTPPSYFTPYTLSVFLTTYGQPTEVRLWVYPSGDLPFYVTLFYPELGIAALYLNNGAWQGEFIHGCPQAHPVDTLQLRSPSSDFTFEQLVASSSAFNLNFLPLEETTGMDVTTFYETFQNADNTTCLETPANLWP